MKTTLQKLVKCFLLSASAAIPSLGQISDCTITATESSICLGETSTLSVNSNSCGFLPSPLQTGINALYSFCGNANDLSSNNNHGVVNGAGLTTDINNSSNSAYSFNGISNTINISNPFLGGVQVNQFTMNTRVYFNSISNSPNIWGKTRVWGEVNFQIDNDGTIILWWANSITGNKYSTIFSESGIITNNTWYDISVVFQNGTSQIYLNGSPITTNLQWTAQGGTILSTTTIENSCNFAQDANSSKLGVRMSGSGLGGYLDGKIDEFKIWNYALNASQIQQNYQSSNLNTTWSDGTTNQSNILIQPSQTTTYSVMVSDGVSSCTDDITIVVNIPQINAGTDLNACLGDQVTLSATGAVNYSWDNGIIQDVPFIPSSSLSYTVTGTDAEGCIGTDQVIVNVNALPTIGAGNDQTVCEGSSLVLSGSGGISYSWTNGVQDGVSFVPSVGSTTYTVTGTDNNNCTNTDDVVVIVSPLPSISAGPDQTVCEDEFVTLNGNGGTTYTWDNNVTNGTPFIPAQTGNTTYTVTSPSSNGCVGSDEVVITVNPLPAVTGVVDQTIFLSSNNSTSFTVPSGATSYQWQTDLGVGFQNLTNAGQYSGVTTNTLTISNLTLTNNNQQFRCIVTDGNCEDTSDVAVLTVIDDLSVFEMNGVEVKVYPNPADNVLFLSASAEMKGVIRILDMNGRLLFTQEATGINLNIPLEKLTSGSYLLQIGEGKPIQFQKK